MRLRPGLKTRAYANFAWRNPWLFCIGPKVRNYLRYRLLAPTEIVDAGRRGPVFLTLSITRRCNLTCRFCIVGDVLNRPGWRETEATVESACRVLDHPLARCCLYVMLTGGEPLLNDDVGAIVRMAKARRHLVGITTNGLLLREHARDLQAAGLDVTNISVYDENRDALAAIVPAVVGRLYCKLCAVIGKDDVERHGRLEDYVRFARETGCRRLFFQNTYPHVDGLAKLRDSSIPPRASGAEKRPISDEQLEYPDLIADLTRRYPDVAVSWPAPVRRHTRAKTCRMPWYILGVDAAGNTAMCSNHASCTGPSLFGVPLEQAMNTEPWRSTRRALLARNAETPPLCVGCYTLDDPWRRDM